MKVLNVTDYILKMVAFMLCEFHLKYIYICIMYLFILYIHISMYTHTHTYIFDPNETKNR